MKLSLNSFFHGISFALRHCKFRDGFLKVKQYKILDAILFGKDVIGVLPTGYGKSIIFQLLPFIQEYLLGKDTIVIVIGSFNCICTTKAAKSFDRRFFSSKSFEGSWKPRQAEHLYWDPQT